MLSLCFSGLLLGLVGLVTFVSGAIGLFIAKALSGKNKDLVKVYKISKIFTLAVVYYCIAIVSYFGLNALANRNGSYVSCSDAEGIEASVMIVYVIVTGVMIREIKTSDCRGRINNKIYTRTANSLVLLGFLLVAAFIFI